MGEEAVPGGQEEEVPPQQEHRKPSIAQYFQYSQLSGLSGLALAAWTRLARSTGSKGSSAAPVSICPSDASRLRREVRCASERVERSNKRSNVRIGYPVPLWIEQHPGRLRGMFIDIPQPAGKGIEHCQVAGLRGDEQYRCSILGDLRGDRAREPLHLDRPARQAAVSGEVVYPDFGAAVLMGPFTAFVHGHVQPPELLVDGAHLVGTRPPVPFLGGPEQRPGRGKGRLVAGEIDIVHFPEEGEEQI